MFKYIFMNSVHVKKYSFLTSPIKHLKRSAIVTLKMASPTPYRHTAPPTLWRRGNLDQKHSKVFFFVFIPFYNLPCDFLLPLCCFSLLFLLLWLLGFFNLNITYTHLYTHWIDFEINTSVWMEKPFWEKWSRGFERKSVCALEL